jgi:hypothetical protein
MKLVVAVIVIFSFTPAAKSQLEDGSVLIVTYSPREIAMAADSRVTNVVTGQFRDSYCKISEAGGKIMFGGTGLLEGAGVSDMGSNYRAGLVEETAARWADAMDRNYAKMPPERVKQFVQENAGNRSLDCSVFAGIEPSGDLSLVRARLFYGGSSSGAPGPFQYRIETIPLASPVQGYLNIAACGNIDVLQKFTPPQTDSTRAEVNHWKLLTGDVKAQIAVRLVQLTIEREKPKQYGGHKVIPVGGPIDAAEIRQGSGIKWLQRKSSCPADSTTGKGALGFVP